MAKINAIKNALPKIHDLYVTRKVDEDAKDRIRVREEENVPYKNSDEDIYITGLSKVGKKTFSTSVGNLNFDSENTEYIKCETDVNDSENWLKLLSNIKENFEEDLNCRLPLTGHYLSLLRGKNDHLENRESLFERLLTTFVVLIRTKRVKYTIAVSILLMYLIPEVLFPLSSEIMNLLQAMLSELFNEEPKISLGIQMIMGMPSALIVGIALKYYSVKTSSKRNNLTEGRIKSGHVNTKPLSFIRRLKIDQLKAHLKVNVHIINQLESHFKSNAEITDKKLKNSVISELVRILHLEIKDSNKWDSKKSFAISIEIRHEEYNSNHEQEILSTISSLFENRKSQKISYILISNKANFFNKLEIKESDVYEVELFDPNEALEYTAKHINSNYKITECNYSLLGAIWNDLNNKYASIFREINQPKYECYEFTFANELVSQIRNINRFINEIDRVKNKDESLKTAFNEFKTVINLLISLVENADNKYALGCTVQELVARINVFNERFGECSIENLGGKIKENLDTILKQKYLSDYRNIRKLSDKNLKLTCAYIKLWIQHTEGKGNRLDSLLSLDKKGNDCDSSTSYNHSIKNTVCLMVSVEKKIIDAVTNKIEDSFFTEYDFIRFNDGKFKTIKSYSSIFDEEGDIKPEIRSFIAYDRNHYTTAIEGIRIYYEKFVSWVLDDNNDHRNIGEISKLFRRIYIAEEQLISERRNEYFHGDWEHGIFSHPSSVKFVTHIQKYFCDKENNIKDSIYENLNDSCIINHAAYSLTEIIMRASTSRYNAKNSICVSTHFCRLLKPNVKENEIGRKYVNVAENYIKQHMSDNNFNETKICDYFFRVAYPAKGKECCWDETFITEMGLKCKPESIANLNDLIYDYQNEIFNHRVDKEDRVESSEKRDEDLLQLEKLNFDALIKLKKTLYHRRNFDKLGAFHKQLLDVIKEVRQSEYTDIFKDENDTEQFRVFIETIRKSLNSVTAYMYSSKMWGQSKDYTERYNECYKEIYKFVTTFERWLKETSIKNDPERKYLLTSHIIVSLILWEKTVGKIKNNTKEFDDNLHGKLRNFNLQKSIWLDRYCQIAEIVGEENNYRQQFESEHRQKFAQVEDKKFCSIFYSNDQFEDFVQNWFNDNQKQRDLFKNRFSLTDDAKYFDFIKTDFIDRFKPLSNGAKLKIVKVVFSCFSAICDSKNINNLTRKNFYSNHVYPIYQDIIKINGLPLVFRHTLNTIMFIASLDTHSFSVEVKEKISFLWAETILQSFDDLKRNKNERMKEWYIKNNSDDEGSSNNKFDTGKKERLNLDKNYRYYRAAKAFSAINYTNSADVTESVLELLSTFNTQENISQLTQGDYFVATIIGLSDQNVVLEATNCEKGNYDFEYIKMDKNLIPTAIYNTIKHSLGVVAAYENNVSQEYYSGSMRKEDAFKLNDRSYIGKKLLVTKVEREEHKTIFVTAKGPTFVSYLTQLFMPFKYKWELVNPRRSLPKNSELSGNGIYTWSGDLWVGASNSLIVVRVEDTLNSAYLAGNGNWPVFMNNILNIRRFMLFAQHPDKEATIRSFLKMFFDGLAFKYDRDSRELKIYPSKSQEEDARKIRTFTSIYRKVFSEEIEVDGVEEKSELEVQLIELKKKWDAEPIHNTYYLTDEIIKNIVEKSKDALDDVKEYLENERKFDPSQISAISEIVYEVRNKEFMDMEYGKENELDEEPRQKVS